ncbi:hypothetical protein [Acrocarpospora sp. B8E8]|uniref:hypothetical protein n=1 Tax=Acrocarpospora sp. B8E8 TaxID=3153572 RepID=UPI00325F2ED8
MTDNPHRPQTPDGSWYRIECPGGQIRYVWVPAEEAGPEVTAQELMLRAMRDLRLPVPAVRTAPPRGSDGMVGIPLWFWIPESQWRPITRRVQTGPTWAQVTATPRQLVIEPGHGQRGVRCQGPGMPYRPYQGSLPTGSPPGSCSYTFTRSSAGLRGAAYPVRASVVWGAAWQGSGGAGAVLDAQVSTTTFDVRIAEGQALIMQSASQPSQQRSGG